MNTILKRILTALLIWVVPFVAAVLIWDPITNQPQISTAWFNALMGFCWAISYSIALFIYFKKPIKNPLRESVVTGVTWYLTLVLLDLIVLVGIFGSTFADYAPMILMYLNVLIINIAVGKILSK